jgi:hypothetical protein
MKKIHTTFKTLLIFLFLFGFSTSLSAQDEISGLFKSNKEDAQKLIQAYLNPFLRGFGTGINSNWNTSAATKKFGRVELRLGMTGVMIPESDQFFDITKLGLSSNIAPADPSKTLSPTIGGDKINGPLMNIYANNVQVGQFVLPKGAELPFVPAPQLQATVGFIKGMDFTVRYVPNIKLGESNGTIGMMGGGVKVNLLRLFTGKLSDKVLPFDLAAAVGYTRLTYQLPLEVRGANNSIQDPNQKLEARFEGLNIEAILSKKVLFFTPFISMAYQKSESNVDLKGVYPFQVANNTYVNFTDPISINQKNPNSLRTNVGLQFNLLLLRVFGSYSFGDFEAFNAGIGIGIGR